MTLYSSFAFKTSIYPKKKYDCISTTAVLPPTPTVPGYVDLPTRTGKYECAAAAARGGDIPLPRMLHLCYVAYMQLCIGS